jgi:hypothetical protein
MPKRFFEAFLLLGLALLFQTDSQAADVNVGATVPDSSVSFSGFAPAGSTVTIRDSGTTVATTTTSAAGTFSRSFVTTAGVHDFSLFLTDTVGRTTPETFFDDVNVPTHADLPISNVHLPPTIALSKTSINKGETTLVSGQAAPGSTVHVIVNGVERYSAVVGSGSSWQFTLTQTGYQVGNNSIHAYLTRTGLANSVNSFTKTLVVANCKRSDLNCDGRVNITDFSILLYYWGTSNATADTNDDGKVGLIDFSIMLFDWTD